MIRFKIDILDELKKKGYNSNRIRQEKVISEGALQKIRNGGVPGIVSINNLCEVLKKQPGQLLEYVQDQEDQED